MQRTDGKDEEVIVWKYPEEKVAELDDLHERHGVVFNFARHGADLQLTEKRKWVIDTIRKEPRLEQIGEAFTLQNLGHNNIMALFIHEDHARIAAEMQSRNCNGSVCTITKWKKLTVQRQNPVFIVSYRQTLLKENLWVRFDNIQPGFHGLLVDRLERQYTANKILKWILPTPKFLAPHCGSMTVVLEVKIDDPSVFPPTWKLQIENRVVEVRVSTKTSPICFRSRKRGHMGTGPNCPKFPKQSKEKKLLPNMLVEVEDAPGTWFVADSNYDGYVRKVDEWQIAIDVSFKIPMFVEGQNVVNILQEKVTAESPCDIFKTVPPESDQDDILSQDGQDDQLTRGTESRRHSPRAFSPLIAKMPQKTQLKTGMIWKLWKTVTIVPYNILAGLGVSTELVAASVAHLASMGMLDGDDDLDARAYVTNWDRFYRSDESEGQPEPWDGDDEKEGEGLSLNSGKDMSENEGLDKIDDPDEKPVTTMGHDTLGVDSGDTAVGMDTSGFPPS
ncbi:hypothetical protein CBR_g45715 [Chara braunii]|uniref:DUF4283 domain-containing protein n=1 Tax=Chara braunii TaxID=69332 RepID=A0A388K3M7_CHABU|nr:hypothetical protein CBR_g45715 [Chara braunii]|eukprot:GBG64660.1 hypothetical protein CBR_g45715 [Chara braunii]